MKLHYRNPKGHPDVTIVDGDLLEVRHLLRKCGMGFKGIALVYDNRTGNPLICVPSPLGINAVRQIIEHVTKGDSDGGP